MAKRRGTTSTVWSGWKCVKKMRSTARGSRFEWSMPRNAPEPRSKTSICAPARTTTQLWRLSRRGTTVPDPTTAREAISGPLDVHECSGPAFLAVVILDGHGPPRELEHVLIGGRERLSLLFGGRNVLDQTMAPGVVDQLELLRAEPLPDQRGVALFERGLVNVEAIRDDTALDDVLAKPPRRSYEHDVWEARLGVQGEDDAGGGQVRADHLLDTDREGYLKVVEAHVLAVADGARGKEAREAPLDRLYELCFSPNVKETLLLAREAGRWQVLSGCRRADGHVRVLFPVFIGEIAVATQDLRLQVFRYVTAQDQVLYQVASAGESLDIAAVKP